MSYRRHHRPPPLAPEIPRATTRARRLASGLVLSCAVAGCGIDQLDERMRIDEYIFTIDRQPLPEAGKEYGPPGEPLDDGDYLCTTQPVSETRQYDRLVAFAADSEALWPGAIVSGNSLGTSQLRPLPFDRSPVSFSVSLGNLQGERSVTLAAPKLSSYRDALAELLSAELSGATAASLYSEIEEVHSTEQLALSLGVEASLLFGLAGSVRAGFDFESDQVRSRFLVKYTQAYYTVDLDPPGLPSDFFADSVTVQDVKRRIPADEPPLYVSSITYGRMVMFTFESVRSARELEAALDFAYRGEIGVGGDVEAAHRAVLEETQIRAYILGGNAGDAARSVDSYEALMDFIKQGGNFSPASPGAPIAYKLAFLSDNQPARLALTEEYEVRECSRISQRVRVVLESLEVEETGDSGGDLDVYGQIWALGAGDEALLFDRGQQYNVEIPEGERWPAEGYIAEAILDVTPASGEVIELGAALTDHDTNPFDADDSIGDEVFRAPFESGWDRRVSMLLTGANSRLRLNFVLQPI